MHPEPTTPAAERQPKARSFVCGECGNTFVNASKNTPLGGRGTPLFCGDPCKNAHHNRAAKRGKIAMPLLMAWRAGRGSTPEAKFAMAEMTRLADAWNAEDTATKRRSATKVVRRKMADGWSSADVLPRPVARG